MLHFTNLEDFKKDLAEELKRKLLGKNIMEIRFTEFFLIWVIIDEEKFRKDLRMVSSIEIEIPGDDILDELDPKTRCFDVVQQLVDEVLIDSIDWCDGVNTDYSMDEDEEMYYFVEDHDEEDDADDYEDEYDSEDNDY